MPRNATNGLYSECVFSFFKKMTACSWIMFSILCQVSGRNPGFLLVRSQYPCRWWRRHLIPAWIVGVLAPAGPPLTPPRWEWEEASHCSPCDLHWPPGGGGGRLITTGRWWKSWLLTGVLWHHPDGGARGHLITARRKWKLRLPTLSLLPELGWGCSVFCGVWLE